MDKEKGLRGWLEREKKKHLLPSLCKLPWRRLHSVCYHWSSHRSRLWPVETTHTDSLSKSTGALTFVFITILPHLDTACCCFPRIICLAELSDNELPKLQDGDCGAMNTEKYYARRGSGSPIANPSSAEKTTINSILIILVFSAGEGY